MSQDQSGNWNNIKARFLRDLQDRNHDVLENRDAPHSHPASAIDGLITANAATTVVTEQTIGQAPAVGASVLYARGDHTHGTPPAPTLGQLSDVVVAAPSTDQILKFNGTNWINGAQTAVQPGPGVIFYLDSTKVIPAGVGPQTKAMETLLKTPSVAVEVDETQVVNNNTLLIDQYMYNTALGVASIDAGEWTFDVYTYVDDATDVSELISSVYKVVVGTGNITITGIGTSRTATVVGGTPFVAGDFNANLILTSRIITPNAVLVVTGFTDDHTLTIECLATYTNEAGVVYSIDRYLFQSSTGDLNNLSVSLITNITVQPAFPINITDKLVARFFAKTNHVGNVTIHLVHNGTQHYTHFHTPLSIKHNDLAGLQGGTANEDFHLTSAEYTGVGTGVFVRQTAIPTNLNQLTTRLHNDTQNRDVAGGHTVLSKLNNVPEHQRWNKTIVGHMANSTLTGVAGQTFGVAITFDGTYIWVSTDSSPVQILKIDPATNTVVATVVGGAGQNRGYGLTFDGRYVWSYCLTFPYQLLKIDPSTNSIVATVVSTEFAAGNSAITFDGTYVWTGCGTAPAKFQKINPNTNTIVNTITAGAGENFVQSLTFDGRFVWATLNLSPSKILKIDPMTDTIVTTITEGPFDADAIGICFDGTYLWVTHLSTPVRITKIDPSTGSVVAEIVGSAGQDIGLSICFDGTYIWAPLEVTPLQLLKIDPNTATVVQVITGGAGENLGYATIFDGTYLWVVLDTNPVKVMRFYNHLRKVDSFARIPFDVTAARAGAGGLNTVFTNSNTNQALLIQVTVRCNVGATLGSQAYIQAKSPVGPPVPASGIVGIQSGLVDEDNNFQLVVIIPPGAQYMISSTTTNTGMVTLDKWFETLL